LLKSLDAQQNLRALSLPSNSRGAFGSQLDRPILRPRETDSAPQDVESMHRLAVLYHKRGNFEKAERLYQEALTIYGLSCGTRDTRVGQLLNNVARLYIETFWYAEAEPLLARSLEIARHHYGAAHPKVARRLANMAELCAQTGRGEDAVKFFQQAAAIESRELGNDSPQTRSTMRACATLLRRLGRAAEAEPIEKMCHRERRSDRRTLLSRRKALTAPPAAGKFSAGERRRGSERRALSTRRSGQTAPAASA
jgi:tetratricopeptide (TPR) repeat protein